MARLWSWLSFDRESLLLFNYYYDVEKYRRCFKYVFRSISEINLRTS